MLYNIPFLQLNYFCILGTVNKTNLPPNAKPPTLTPHVMRPTTTTTTTTTMPENIPTEQPVVETIVPSTSDGPNPKGSITIVPTTGGSHPNGSGKDFTITGLSTDGFNRGTTRNDSTASRQSSRPADDTGTSTEEGENHFLNQSCNFIVLSADLGKKHPFISGTFPLLGTEWLIHFVVLFVK